MNSVLISFFFYPSFSFALTWGTHYLHNEGLANCLSDFAVSLMQLVLLLYCAVSGASPGALKCTAVCGTKCTHTYTHTRTHSHSFSKLSRRTFRGGVVVFVLLAGLKAEVRSVGRWTCRDLASKSTPPPGLRDQWDLCYERSKGATHPPTLN